MAIFLNLFIIIVLIASFFDPKDASIIYLVFLLIFEGYLLYLNMLGQDIDTSKLNLSIFEEPIFKKYYLYFYFPYTSRQLSSVLSCIQIFTFIWVPWLLIKGQTWQAVIIGLNYFVAGFLSVRLNPLFFLSREILKNPSFANEIVLIENIINKIIDNQIVIKDKISNKKETTSINDNFTDNKTKVIQPSPHIKKDDLDYLVEAIKDRNVTQAEQILKKGIKINLKNSEGIPIILKEAVSRSNANILNLLISYGLDLHAKDKQGKNALMWAISSISLSTLDKIEIVKILLKNNISIDEKDENGWTGLTYAVYHGYYDIIKILLKYGADINTKDIYGWTPLMRAAYEGQIEIVKLLIENNANINAKNFSGKTALSLASERGHINIMKILIENGAK